MSTVVDLRGAMHMRDLRTFASTLVGIAGVIALLTGFLLSYSSRTLFTADIFADRVAASLENPGVASLVAGRVTDALVAGHRDLTPYRPILLGAVRAVVTSDPFRGIVRRAARTAHETIMSEESSEVVLTISDIGAVLEGALASQPEIASRVPADVPAAVVALEDLPVGDLSVRLLKAAHRLDSWRLAFWLLGPALMSLGLLLSVHRLRTLLQQGLALIFISVALFVIFRFGGNMIARATPDADVAGAIIGLWSTFTSGFLTWVFVLSGLGLIVVAGATSLLKRFDPAGLARSTWRALAAEPESPALRLLRAVALIGLGLVLVIWPLEVVTTLAFLAGVGMAFVGLGEIFDLLLGRAARAAAAGGSTGRGRGTLCEVALVIVVAAALVACGALLLGRSSQEAAVPVSVGVCNGSPDLCERPLDRVVFAGTHNSMGAADIPDWMFANQERGIREQLQDGIRALLIDAHPAVPAGDRVKTLLEDESAARAAYEEVLGKEGVDAAMRIRDRLVGEDEGSRDVYLCHGFCELGALAMTPMLADIRSFLIAHPNEVLIIVIQDEGVSPAEVERCFEESRLIDFVYRGRAAPPWPTLRQMVMADQRVLVMAEHDSEGVPWYHDAYTVMQETPYRFHDPSEFSCEPNRGGTSGSLLLMNHWIETAPSPLPSNAEIVNAYDFLLERARRCGRERGKLPNIIAVDFYRTGDLLDVVDTLNGIASK
jgi:hypothetical protein